ncbi:alpha/beta hydrolase, partial [Bacillus subtilis]|nr:alpha/beta hydrolase [Bacillus subtilis]
MDAKHNEKAVIYGNTAGGKNPQQNGYTRPHKESHLIQTGAYPAVQNVIGQNMNKLGKNLLEKKHRFIKKNKEKRQTQ